MSRSTDPVVRAARAARIADMVAAGAGDPQIGAALGLERSGVGKLRRGLGLPPGRAVRHPGRVSLIRRMAARGATDSAIGAALGLSRSHIAHLRAAEAILPGVPCSSTPAQRQRRRQRRRHPPAPPSLAALLAGRRFDAALPAGVR